MKSLNNDGMLTREGVRFVLDVLAREFACNATEQEIEEAMSDQTNIPITLVVDWEGAFITGSLSSDEHTEQVATDLLTFDDECAELLGRRAYVALSKIIDAYNHDLNLVYEACDDRYYEDNYDEYDDDDVSYGLDDELW